MKPPSIPGRMHVESGGDSKDFLFRCDDSNGFMLRIFWAMDGDLHISVVADPDHEDAESNCQYISGSVRLRVPMLGGGCFAYLHEALIDALRAEHAAALLRHVPSR